MSSEFNFKRLLWAHTLTGFFTCCSILWCMVIQHKMQEIQHICQMEFREIKKRQNHYVSSVNSLEAGLQSVKLSVNSLAESVAEQRNLVKTTMERQLQISRDLTRCSEDLLNLHAKHPSYPQSYVDKAKDELKHHFEAERGKIFENLYEEKIRNLHEIVEIQFIKYKSPKEVKYNSSNQHSSESHLTKNILVPILNDLKRSMKKLMMTSKSTLHYLHRLLRQQVSELAEARLWTVRQIQQKFKHNGKVMDALNVHLKSNKKGILSLNDTINSLKSFCLSYPSFAYRCGHEIKRKCIKGPDGMETLQYKPDGIWDLLIIPALLVIASVVYVIWTNRPSGNKEVVKQWMESSLTKKKPQPIPESKENLENSLCVVCFGYGSDKQKYVHLASELMGSGFSLQMKKVVVNSTESLETLPPSKVILMFVDYNERNLIIEEEQGGLKRETLLMLQGTGAEVTVVYCYELSSKHLDEGRLFAQKLTVVERMKELRELRDRNSIFSIYNTFNPTQKEVFRSKLKNSC
ncbi:uncharacterized protein LOC134271379 [Saccostrea cucullata]|uniref:uncharacterized protein LOC134271379 n=1 Tax=Saccostrea cuccullata TaxID=36930 RepID=UPI002ED5C7D3